LKLKDEGHQGLKKGGEKEEVKSERKKIEPSPVIYLLLRRKYCLREIFGRRE